MRVLIISGEKQGQNIADRLLAKDEYRIMFRSAEHQVTFIEEDEAICKELEQRYNCPIYQGDGTKKELLGQVGLDNIDVVIAAFEDEGRNDLPRASSGARERAFLVERWLRRHSKQGGRTGPLGQDLSSSQSSSLFVFSLVLCFAPLRD